MKRSYFSLREEGEAGIWAKILFFKTTYLCGAREGTTVGQKTYETNISILPAIEAFWKKTYHPFSRFQEELRKRESVSLEGHGGEMVARRAKCKRKKSARQPRAFTLVFNGCDWTVSFRGGLKWKSRRNGKTHQNEIQDSDRPWRRGESLEKIRIYFISLSTRIQMLFFLPPFFPITARVFSPRRSPASHPLATLFPRPSSVTWKSHARLSWDIKAEFIKIYVIKAT